MRTFLVSTALLVASLAAAQTVQPTASTGNETVIRGGLSASVKQNVNLMTAAGRMACTSAQSCCGLVRPTTTFSGLLDGMR